MHQRDNAAGRTSVATLVAIVFLILLAFWVINQSEDLVGAMRTGSFERVAAELNNAIVRSVSQVTELFGGSRAKRPARAPFPEPPAGPPAPPTRARRSGAANRTASGRGATSGTTAAPSSPQTEPTPPAPVDTGTAADDTTTYDAGDPDVTPPVAIRPSQVLTSPPAGVAADRLVELELQIDASGAVQKVVMRSAPNPIHDVAIVSTAKTWRFRPAIKDGRPVRYRRIVWVTIPD